MQTHSIAETDANIQAAAGEYMDVFESMFIFPVSGCSHFIIYVNTLTPLLPHKVVICGGDNQRGC